MNGQLLTNSNDDSASVLAPLPAKAQAINFLFRKNRNLDGCAGIYMDQQMLSNLSIRAKIVIVVSILLAVVAAISAMALREISGIKSNLTEVEAKWLRSATTVGEMQASILIPDVCPRSSAGR